ncbi:CAP domain-containing protein [Streptomyces sp. NPDC006879]|uniref:CAP domain-containing protein n=1 Tax=Streptomyces sp. NPDC006879 TaxID=3364767 RepID=UPI0036B32C38
MPVRTGLLGVSAAMALGATAVATGLVPVGDEFILGSSGDPDTRARAVTTPSTALSQQGGADGLPTEQPSQRHGAGTIRTGGSPTPDTPASASVNPTPSAKPSAAPSPTTEKTEQPPKTTAPKPKTSPPAPKPSPPKPAPTTAKPSPPPVQPPGGDTASNEEAAVLALVNQERAAAGCRPLTMDPALAELAGAYSKDMAIRGFFDHTDPDGRSPWDRAEAAGISGMAAENIARGQADARAVMTAWMNSPGHRANILNCEYRTLGVGAYLADGGPWWTQNFGF